MSVLYINNDWPLRDYVILPVGVGAANTNVQIRWALCLFIEAFKTQSIYYFRTLAVDNFDYDATQVALTHTPRESNEEFFKHALNN